MTSKDKKVWQQEGGRIIATEKEITKQTRKPNQ